MCVDWLAFCLCSSPLSTTHPTYHRTINEVVSLCGEVAELVSPIVCSSSPEGFLPESEETTQLAQVSSSSVRMEHVANFSSHFETIPRPCSTTW